MVTKQSVTSRASHCVSRANLSIGDTDFLGGSVVFLTLNMGTGAEYITLSQNTDCIKYK